MIHFEARIPWAEDRGVEKQEISWVRQNPPKEGFTAAILPEGLVVCNDADKGQDMNAATAFIAAFLAQWRPGLAVALHYREEGRRVTRGRVLIGPEGIHKVAGSSWGKPHRKSKR